jgi:acetyltransferase-like isoleucine patch superfamily enzyme
MTTTTTTTPRHRSHGTGAFSPADFKALGADCVFESGVMVFHPENISLGRNVYVGHQAILKGYYKSQLSIGDETWIGQQVFMHAGGGLTIGARVGIGPGVKILTSEHQEAGRDVPVLFAPVAGAPVHIADDADIGIGAIILPGVTVGKGALVGAGAVVTRDVPEYAVVAGSPARILRHR